MTKISVEDYNEFKYNFFSAEDQFQRFGQKFVAEFGEKVGLEPKIDQWLYNEKKVTACVDYIEDNLVDWG